MLLQKGTTDGDAAMAGLYEVRSRKFCGDQMNEDELWDTCRD